MNETDNLKRLNEFCRNSLVEHLGIEYTAMGEGWIEARMPIDHRTCRPDGLLHGGANMALAETIGGVISAITLPENEAFKAFGIEINGNHMKQAKGRYVVARGTFIHKGRTTHVVNVEIRDEFGNLVTISRVTNIITE